MKKMKKSTVYTVQAALIAALYAVLTYAVSPLSYGETQFRISEALTILPIFTPAAIPGLTIGCIISNIGSPYGIIDIIFGTVATLFAALMTRLTRGIRFKKIPLLSMLFPTLFNAIFVGAEIMMYTPGQAGIVGFLTCASGVALGEIVVCYTLGLFLFFGIERTHIFDRLQG
jgi:uncharacterized membrane protein